MPPRGTLAAVQDVGMLCITQIRGGPIIVLQCHSKITRVQSRTIAKLWGKIGKFSPPTFWRAKICQFWPTVWRW